MLLLRDVLGFSAAETAQLLETTVAGANSALQRARAALEPHRAAGRVPRQPRPAGDQAERQLLGRYVAAWHASDVPALLSLSSAYGIMVLTGDGGHIIEITGFADPALFADFGLPARLEG